MRKQWKPGPFLLPFSGLGTRLGRVLVVVPCFHWFLQVHITFVSFKMLMYGIYIVLFFLL